MPLGRPDGGSGVSQRPGSYIPSPPSPRPAATPQGYPELQNLWGNLLASTAPAIANQNAMVGNLYGQLGQISANQGYQSGLLNQYNQNAMAGMGLQEEQLGIQREQLGRQNQLAPEQYNLQQQLFGNQFAALGNQREAAQYGYNRNKQDFVGATAAQGASNSGRMTTGLSDLSHQLQQQLGNIGLSESNLGINRQQYELNYGERLAQMKDEGKNLDILSRKLGLDKNEIQNRTSQALAQLGLSSALSAGDIYNSILNAQNGIYDRLAPILGTIYQYTGIRPVG